MSLSLEVVIITAVLAAILLAYFGTIIYWKIREKCLRLPPGPLRLPLIGNLWYFFLKTNQVGFNKFLTTDNGYRDIISVYAPNFLVILLSNEAIHEVFVENADKVSIRPLETTAAIYEITKGRSLSEKDGRWQPLLQLATSAVASAPVEEIIMGEVEFFIQELRELNASPFYSKALQSKATCNIVTKIIFGERLPYSDNQLENLKDTKFAESTLKSSIISVAKLKQLAGLNEAREKAEATVRYTKHQVKEHRRMLDKRNPRDYIDAYLTKMNEKCEDSNNLFTEENLCAMVLSLYLGGVDSPSVALSWSFLYLIILPETQDLIYSEIQQVAGCRELCYEDRHAMNYTMSFITEVTRKAIASNSIPHLTTEEIKVKGYTIPKETVVVGGIWSSCINESLFPSSNTFNPQRFLDSTGKFQNPNDKLIPFCIGRRRCPGEQIARKTMFFFLTGVVRNFLLQTNSERDITDDGIMPFCYEPKPFLVKFIPR